MKSYNQEIDKVILHYLQNTKKSIKINVPWFTDAILFDKLKEMASKGVEVELILEDDENNRQASFRHEEITKYGGKLYWHKKEKGINHEKYCLIDNNVLLYGSYNWTYSAATYNNESIIVIESMIDGKQMIDDFSARFEKIKNSENIKIIEEKLRSDLMPKVLPTTLITPPTNVRGEKLSLYNAKENMWVKKQRLEGVFSRKRLGIQKGIYKDSIGTLRVDGYVVVVHVAEELENEEVVEVWIEECIQDSHFISEQGNLVSLKKGSHRYVAVYSIETEEELILCNTKENIWVKKQRLKEFFSRKRLGIQKGIYKDSIGTLRVDGYVVVVHVAEELENEEVVEVWIEECIQDSHFISEQGNLVSLKKGSHRYVAYYCE